MNMNTQKYKHLLRNKDGKAITVVITIIVLLFVAITIAVGVAVFLYNNNSQAYNMSSTDKIYYELKEGASVDSIAQDLDDQGIIGNPFWFKLRAKFTHMDSGIKPGIYGLSASMKADELLRIMNSGVSEVNVINILPGDTTKKIMQSVVAAGIMTEEQFWDLVKNGEWDYDFLEGAPKDETRLEGFLYPDEYTFVFETEPVEVIRKMLDTFASKWTPEMYNQAASMGKSVRDVVIEASLIERETFTKSEYPIIASVINNRINAGMRLQIDATIQYILPEPK
ncbi:MAG: endolytic transglycosylase MltG, partial [Clostridiales Family XIII bacterium]|nr:endolytic transglycosylase MltG [Clostridiales Family XIII bacterium]